MRAAFARWHLRRLCLIDQGLSDLNGWLMFSEIVSLIYILLTSARYVHLHVQVTDQQKSMYMLHAM